MFHPLLAEWFRRRFAGPTPAQELAWPAIARGQDVLVVAPTGAGKTLAAFAFFLDQLVREALARPLPDAVFCFNDPTAMGAMKAVLEAGKRVPEDVAIAGCGNVAYSDFLRIPLTSVDQQSDGIGERTARMAIALLENGASSRAKTVLLEPQLVVRASTMR